MTFKPPRYVAREMVITRILKDLPKGNFLEVGHGEGDLLVGLSHLGFHGQAFDFSTSARETACAQLAKERIEGITILDQFPDGEKFDYLLFFEVIGYFENPLTELRKFATMLNPSGQILFSFVRKDAGYSLAATGNMKCYSKSEIIELLDAAGFTVNTIQNFGFPFINLIKPLHTLSHHMRARKNKEDETKPINAELTGIRPELLLTKFLGILFGKGVLKPLLSIQFLFKNTDLGNGYVVLASKCR